MIRLLKNSIASFFVAYSMLFSGTEDTSISGTAYVVTVGSNLTATYLNGNTTYLRLYFTLDADFDQLELFAESTSGDIGGCTESQFNGTRLTMWSFDGSGTGIGSIYGPGGNFSQAQHYVDVNMDNLLARIDQSNWADADAKRIYLGLKLGGTNNNWVCPRVNTDNGNSTDDGATDGTYYYHTVDRTAPTLSTILDGNDKVINAGSSVDHLDNYTNSNQYKITIGSENVASVKATWTKDDGDGSSIGQTTIANATNASATFTATQASLTNNTRYDISFVVADAAGNTNTYNRNNIWYDTTAPTVIGVVSEESNGARLAQGEQADFYVEFDEKIDFSGTPTITIRNKDGATSSVNCASCSDGSTKAYFDYTVADGDYSPHLDYANQDALGVGTYIKDYAGNNLADCTGCAGTLPTPPTTFGQQKTGSNNVDKSLSNSATSGSFEIDGNDPAAFTVQAVTAVGGTVVANYWNGTNTSATITVPVADDPTLVWESGSTEGIIQLRAEADGSYENIGQIHKIVTGDRGGNVVMSVTNVNIAALSGYSEGDEITFNAIITDRAGNATTGTASSSTLTVDTAAPGINTITSTAGYYKLGESVDLVVTFANNVSITGTPQLTMSTANSPGSGTAAVDKSGLSGAVVTFSYTVGATHYSTALDYADASSALGLNSGTITDVAGNVATLTLPNVGTLPGQTVVRVDGVAPAAFQTSTVVTVGDSVVADYLNADNTGINVTVPIADDASLENGKLYIQAKIGGNAYANVTSAYTIQAADKGTNKTILVSESDIDSNGELTGFAEGAVITFTGLLEDYADGPGGTGNQTVGTGSNTTLTVDQTDPASPTIASITTVGGAVVTGKWNKDNTSATVKVNIANDATLEGGKVQILAKKNSGSYEGVGNSLAIANRDLNGTLDITLTAAHIEGVDSGVSENDILTFKVKIYDVAGNHTTGSAFGTTMTIDQAFPTVLRVTSDDNDANPLGIGDSLAIKIVFSENVDIDVSGGTRPHLTLDLANSPGDANGNAVYQSGSGTATLVFKYGVVANNYSSDTNYENTSSLVLNAGTIRDAAGNNADPRLKAIDDADALAVYNSKDFWIDGVAPADDQVEDVLTVGTTQKAGWWNASNTAATVKVPLSTSDVSLEGGTVQIQAKTDANGFANIGAANAISSADKTAGFKTISLTASQVEGISGYSDQAANPDVISFTAIVTDKAGNSTTYSASTTTLTVDETAPSAFAVDTVFTVGGEICWDDANETDCYWNEDNTSITIQVPIANDATLENGFLVILAETDGTYQKIGPGSRRNGQLYDIVDYPSDYWEQPTKGWTQIASSDLGKEKTVTINGPGIGNKEVDIDEMTGLADGEIINFKAYLMDRAGNRIESSISPTPMTVDETDPAQPVVILKSTSDTGIGDWDNLTKDYNPTFTLTNLANTDSVFLKLATDATALAASTSIIVREKTTGITRDLTTDNYANGLYKISAKAKDIAGNWSVDATETFVRIDTIPPSIPNAPDLLSIDDTGFKDNDDITKTQKPHFILKGLSGTKDSLKLVIDTGGSVGRDSIMSQVTVDTFMVAAVLADGYHTAGVIAIDSAGNVQDTSAFLPFVVDATPPSTPTAPDMTTATDLGQSNSDNFTNTQKPNFDVTNIELGSFINLYGFIPSPTDTTLFDFDTVKLGVTTMTMIPDNNMTSPTNAATGLGEYTLYATSEDTAGNISESADLANVKIDITPPKIIANYYNKTIQTVYNGFTNKYKADSLRFGKGGDELELIAKISEPAGTVPEPTLSVTYGSNSADSFTAKAKTSKSNNDSTWTWKFDLPANARNDGAAQVSFVVYDRAGNLATAFADTQKFIIDNTPPASFTTGLVSAGSIAGSAIDTTVSKINQDGIKYWYMNKGADTVNVLLDLPVNDASLLGGGYVDIQTRVRNRMLTEWSSIDTRLTSNPFSKQDSIQGLGTGKIFTRNKYDIITPLTAKGLIQGDTIDFRARIYDKALNVTDGTLSQTYFVLDTLPPLHNSSPSIPIISTADTTLKNVKGVPIFLTTKRDIPLWHSDTLAFAFRAMNDPAATNEKKSDLQRYEYKIEETPTSAEANWAPFRDWRPAASKVTTNADSVLMLLDTVFLDTFALTHNRNYRALIRGVDQAGNISGDFTTSSVLRFNDKPSIDPIADASAKEDILWEKIITITDRDVATLRSDSFTFSLESYFLRDTNNTKTDNFYTFKNPKIDSLDAKVTSNTGYFTFTPDKWDTTNVKSRGGYIHRIFANDLWGFKDTIDIKMIVEAVNDPPVFNLSSVDMMKFLEGVESDTINLSRYVTDEDDSTHTLTYSANIKTSLQPVDGYPLFGPSQKIIFLSPISKESKKTFINQLIDENPTSTIIQEDNAFLVYNKGVSEFADPLTVKMLILDNEKNIISNNATSKIDDSTFAWIKPLDLDYFNKDTMIVEFTVKDSSLASGVSTVAFAINPLNDKPVWSSEWFKDTIITENDSLYIDFGKYLKDVDDDTLKISILPTTYKQNIMIDTASINSANDSGFVFFSGGLNDTIKFKPQELWFETDGVYQNKSVSSLWDPLDRKSNKIEFKITAADDSTTTGVDTTFTITVQRVPRPEISMYVVQNNAFTNFYEIFIVDSVEKTKEVTLEFGENNPMPLDTAAAYTWYSHIYFRNAGSYFLDVKAKGAVGDTIVNIPLGVVMSFASRPWEGKSADGVFKVKGESGAVDFDQSIIIIDSTLFEPYFNDKASYLMGNESLRMAKSVEISIVGDRDEIAIYRRSTGAGWEELPSVTKNGRIVAFTDRMGYFRKGPKTIIVPGQTSLNQNYPNPFNPSTTIEYDLGFGDGPNQRVNLNIYDLLGRSIKTLLFNEEQTIGRYQIRWDGKDENDIPVSSGVYFIYMQTDKGRTYTKKIMLMR